MPRVESVEYKGITFRRYPDAKQWADRAYFRPSSRYIRQGVQALHREIYADHFGPIPEGWHVHHRDGDPGNNAPENLECLPAADHLEHHAAPRRGQPGNAEHLERAREAAKLWHRSPEGREWHRQHGRNVFGNRPEQEYECEQCGKTYSTKKTGGGRFCSNACKSKWRRAAGLDNVEKQCAACGKTFLGSKYGKTLTCSRQCGGAYRRSRASVQPDGGRPA